MAAILAAVGWAGGAAAADLPVPAGGVLTAEDRAPAAPVPLPAGPWRADALPVIVAQGEMQRQAWRVAGAGAEPDALLAQAEAALVAQGFAPVFTCADRACGGYDFRFALPLLPAPAMHVDLGDYRYLLAVRETEAGPEHVAVVTSRGRDAGFVHLTAVTPAAAAEAAPVTAVPPEAPPAAAAVPDETAAAESAPGDAAGGAPAAPGVPDLGARLRAEGHVVLEGLAFPSGSATLTDTRYESLTALARFLAENEAAVVALVGHTDAVGALESNIRLSRARAQSVRTRLVEAYGSDRTRILAEGAGFLAPVATNLTEEGRAANRRVEAVLVSDG